MAETMAELNRVAELGHLHELYKYPQATIYLTGHASTEIGTFTLSKGLWLLQTKWYFYGSNPVWIKGSWYRMGDTLDSSGTEYSNILDYKCMDDNESFAGVQIVDNAEDKTVHVRVYTNGNTGTYNISVFEVYGVKIR